ncbi:Gliding motility-associated ABC transporter permease protein GldF [uncultured Synechococcales cyanobacterium]|uniref:Gliding motility-associated ABC transporter permease protein GldF n=1 Tax=uncultured Synechococcales cyanobacterium TaxID=1936017 RepID=A0A6J4UR98_9CYAN|nr:Gliding motility-associated ABC transporter permease protein GldF [uncultured Synechococcales cyanobacterium]
MGILIHNVVAIYRKELQSYFASPLAYVIAGVFWLLAGLFFVVILGTAIQQVATLDLQGQQPVDLPTIVLQGFLQVMGTLGLMILPILSMGLYAEERKRGTLELLATSPITNWAIALGKWLGVLTFFTTLVVPLLIYEAIAFSAANPPVRPWVMLVGHGGLILLAAAVLSLGMFISSLTESSILAAILTFALVLVLWVLDLIGQNFGGPVGAALNHLSLLKHYTNLSQGVIDTSSLILFASYILLGIYLTAQSIHALRFQRS